MIAEDLALLLADAHKADLIITVGFQATLSEFLDRGRSGSNPSTFLTRLRLGSKVIDGAAVATLQRSRTPASAVALLAASVLLVVLVALLVSGLGTAFVDVVADAGDEVAAYVKGFFT